MSRPIRDARREPSSRIIHEPAFERVVLPADDADEAVPREGVSSEQASERVSRERMSSERASSELVDPRVSADTIVTPDAERAPSPDADAGDAAPDALALAIASAEQSAADRIFVIPTGQERRPSRPAPTGIGAHLRRERELRAVSLEEIARTTRIPLNVLRSLEADEADALPGDVFVRGFLRSYARALGVDAEPLVARYDQGRRPVVVASTLSTASPERGRRFGLAIAVVVLLILFTLALSIVLRPRHREVPVELSSAPANPLDVA